MQPRYRGTDQHQHYRGRPALCDYWMYLLVTDTAYDRYDITYHTLWWRYKEWSLSDHLGAV